MAALIQSKSVRDLVQQDSVKARLRDIMADKAPQFAAALVQLVNSSKELQKCDPNSVIGCAITAAALDLSIDPNLGEAYIVRYSDKAQFQIGYIGYNQLAMRSGQYKNLGWVVVHEGELVKYDELSGELEVNSSNPDGNIIGYAAKFKLLNGFERGSYWTVERCMKHAERFSKAYRAGLNDASKRDYSVWFQDPDRACLKTVIKGLVKIWGPKSIQMQKALKVDDGAIVDIDSGEVEYPDVESQQLQSPVFKEQPAVEKAPSESEGVKLKSANPVNPLLSREPSKLAPKPAPAPSAAPVDGLNKAKAIEGLIALQGVTSEQLLSALAGLGLVDDDVRAISGISQDVIDMVYDDVSNTTKESDLLTDIKARSTK
jgi:recombination protein RecT